jgi:hypothetical protein
LHLLFQIFLGEGGELRNDTGHGVGPQNLMRKKVDTPFSELKELISSGQLLVTDLSFGLRSAFS